MFAVSRFKNRNGVFSFRVDGQLNGVRIRRNFKTQEEAQAKYDTCATQIASYNAGKSATDIKNLDIYGLDGNKNGVVCEALPHLTPAM